MKNIRYIAEYILLGASFFLFGLLPPARASDLGGWLGRKIGPLLKGFSSTARTNLEAAMPEMSPIEREGVIAGMWENLGRMVGEYPHMEYIGRNRVQIEGREILERIKASGNGSIIAGAHLANWEMASHALWELDLCTIVRLPNNPFTRKLIGSNRGTELVPKSAAGTRQLVKYLKQGRNAGIFIDQKYNEGVAIPFFAIPAMTSPAPVQLAKKFSCLLVPVRFERIGGIDFRITFHEPLEMRDDRGTAKSDTECLLTLGKLLEDWIRDRPEQWIWLHRRWRNNRRPGA